MCSFLKRKIYFTYDALGHCCWNKGDIALDLRERYGEYISINMFPSLVFQFLCPMFLLRHHYSAEETHLSLLAGEAYSGMKNFYKNPSTM